MFAKISINHNTNVIEGGTNEPLSITLDTPAPAGGLVVKYATTGSTTTASDYSLTAGNNITAVTADTFTIAAGATTANLNVIAAKDIVSTPPYKTFIINLPEVVYFDSSSYSAGAQPGSIAAGDFNGDGISDLVTANVNNGNISGNVSVLLSGGGTSTSTSTTNFDVGSSAPSFVTVGDFNGDGKSDLVTANSFSNDVSVLLGNGKGSFGTPIKSMVGSSPNSIAVSDFNGDGKSDLAVIHAGKQVSIVIGNGDGSFGTPTNFELGVGVLNAESVIVGDFNGDGKFDVATANLGTDNISVLLAAKNGGFETSNFTNFKVGTLPNSIAVGDLNGDGKSDLVTANLDSTASVLLGNGDGSFGSATNIGVGGLEAKAVKIGDFDGDGKADLATANFSSNNISVLSGNGDGSFGTPKTFAVGSGPDSLTVGDFNGDGKVDLATANFNSNSVSVLYHNLPPTISPLKIVPAGYDLAINDRVTQLESTIDGKILAVGINSLNLSVITRYNSDGSLDTSFGIAGKLDTGLQNTAPILVSTDGKIIVAGILNNYSYVIRFLANGQQPDPSFANNGVYSTGNTRADNLSFRINPIDQSKEVIINQSGDRELYYLKTSTLLDSNGKIKPLPINDIATATSLNLDVNVLNGILSSTTIDRTNAKVQDILNKLGESLIAEIRSKFSSVQYIGFGAASDGSILIGLSGTQTATFGYLSGVAHFSADGKLDNSFGVNGLTIFPFPTNFQGLADERIDKNDRFCLAIYNPETKNASVYRYTKNGQVDSTFGTNGKVTLPQSFGDFSAYYARLCVVFDSQDRLLVVGDSHSSEIDINQKNSLNVVRINTNGIIDNTFGNNGVLQLSPQQVPMDGRDVLIGKNNSLFVGGSIVSKYDIGSTNSPTPVNPTPVDPTPVNPTPVNPTPVEPTPVNPTPVNPTPVEPTPVNPTPVTPTPVEPTPVNPTPVNPTPVNPTPVNPTPVNPTPVDPTPVTPTPVVDPKISQLIQPTENLLQIQGGTEKSLLKFTKIGQEGVGKNEVIAFVVDDAQGRIGGIAPGSAGYLAAALDKSQVIFSNLGNNSKDVGFDRDSQRYLNFAPGDRVQFALIADDTLDRVKADLATGKSTDKVLFSLPEANPGKANQAKFTAIPNNGGYEIAWEDNLNEGKGTGNTDFNDLVLKVETLDNFTAPIGTGLQGKSEGEVLDLRSFAGQNLKVDTISVSDAGYNNYIGFYAVEDVQGTLANGLKVGDVGYAEAAIKSAILRASKTETQIDRTVTGGKIFAPVVIANGTFEDYLNRNPQNQANSNIHAYFNYLGANTDKVDHFRLLGDNKFGVEDMYGGGDRDYNDIVCQMNVKS
jgi:uncharacterized delta-60 repeat protein